MSKVFITKNGQFLSRGEGVLTQIENPDLEVNDIGVEVSEKIAEDVKEGDLLFQQSRTFKMHPPFHATTGCHLIEMFEHQGEIYCLVVGYAGYSPLYSPLMIYKYENGAWVDYVYHVSQYRTYATTTNDQRGSVLSVGDDIYIHLEYGSQAGSDFGFYRVRDRQIEDITNHFTDSISAYYPPGSSNNYGAYGGGLAELSGIVHFGLCVRDGSTDTPTSSLVFFKYDPENETGSLADINYSGLSSLTATNKADMINYNGELYFVLSHQNLYDTQVDGNYYNWTVFKWNPSLDAWELFCIPISRNPYLENYVRFKEASDGLYLVMEGDSHEEAVFKLNEATNKFDEFWINSVSPIQVVVRMEEVNGKKYLLSTDYYPSTPSGVHIKEYNSSTSSFVEIPGVLVSNPLHAPIGSSAFKASLGSFVSGTNILVAAGDETSFNFYNFDTTTSSFTDLNTFKLKSQYRQTTKIKTIDYNGSSILGLASASNQRVAFYVYDPSTTNWEFLPKADVYASEYLWSMDMFEQNGDLYAVFNAYGFSEPLRVYKLETSSTQFMKLANPSSIPSFTGYSYNLDTVALDTSTQLVALTTSRDLLLFNFSNDVMTSAVTPSGLVTPTTANANNSEVALYDLSGDIFLSVAWYNNNSTSMNFSSNHQSFRYDGSGGWINVPIEYPVSSIGGQAYDGAFINYLNRLSHVEMWEQNGDFWMMIVGYSSPTNRLFKYENGSWVCQLQKTMDYLSNQIYDFNTISKETSQYFFKAGGYPAFTVFERKSNGSFVNHECPLELSNRSNAVGSHVVDGKLILLAQPAYEIQGPIVMTEVDYPKEKVWYQSYSNLWDQTQTLATGIALQDGSKGDIIKIRRIKR
jgi:hypothetical protein